MSLWLFQSADNVDRSEQNTKAGPTTKLTSPSNQTGRYPLQSHILSGSLNQS